MSSRRAIALAVARRAPVPTEHQSQCAVVAWAALRAIQYPALDLLYAIPNFAGHFGNPVSRIVAGRRAKAEGRRAGFPDLGLPVARGGFHGLFVELKREKGARVNARNRVLQPWWHDRLRAEGYCVAVCLGAEAAQSAILTYLTLTPAKP